MSGLRVHQSMVARLRSLPRVFDITELAETMGWSRKAAIVAALRWKDDNAVEPLGDKLGIYFNLIKDTDAVHNCMLNALVKLNDPKPVVLGGITALNRAGWTTQISPTCEVIVPVRRGDETVPLTSKAHLLPRYPRWFKALEENCEEKEEIAVDDVIKKGKLVRGRKEFVVYVKPAFALADTLLSNHRKLGDRAKRKMAWAGFVGDIDDDCLDENRDDVQAALERLGADEEEAELLMARLENNDKFGRRP